MEGILGTVTALLEKTPTILSAILLAGLFLIISPNSLLEAFGVLEFWLNYKAYIGLATLVSGALLFTRLMASLHDWASFRWNLYRNLNELTEEKEALRPYIFNGSNSERFDLGTGIATGLEAKGILYRSASTVIGHWGFPYNLQPVARRILSRKRHLLKKSIESE